MDSTRLPVPPRPSTSNSPSPSSSSSASSAPRTPRARHSTHSTRSRESIHDATRSGVVVSRELETLSRETEMLYKRTEEYRKEKEILRKRIGDIEAAKNELELEVSLLKGDLSRSQEELGVISDKRKEEARRMEQLEERCSHLEHIAAEYHELLPTFDAAKEEIKRLECLLKETEEVKEEAKKKHTDIDKKHITLNRELREKVKHLLALRSKSEKEIEELVNRVEVANAQADFFKRSKASEDARARKSMREMELINQRIERELHTVRKENVELSQKLQITLMELQDHEKKTKDQVDEVVSVNERLRHAKEEAVRRRDELEDVVRERNERMSQMEAEHRMEVRQLVSFSQFSAWLRSEIAEILGSQVAADEGNEESLVLPRSSFDDVDGEEPENEEETPGERVSPHAHSAHSSPRSPPVTSPHPASKSSKKKKSSLSSPSSHVVVPPMTPSRIDGFDTFEMRESFVEQERKQWIEMLSWFGKQFTSKRNEAGEMETRMQSLEAENDRLRQVEHRIASQLEMTKIELEAEVKKVKDLEGDIAELQEKLRKYQTGEIAPGKLRDIERQWSQSFEKQLERMKEEREKDRKEFREELQQKDVYWQQRLRESVRHLTDENKGLREEKRILIKQISQMEDASILASRLQEAESRLEDEIQQNLVLSQRAADLQKVAAQEHEVEDVLSSPVRSARRGGTETEREHYQRRIRTLENELQILRYQVQIMEQEKSQKKR